jgi:topoisomerase IA-like protein
MPQDDDALEQALERAVRIIEEAEARGGDDVLDKLEETAPEPDQNE